ncbi:TetR/AcrR family transcriptional regulator [Roseomonas sp. OT10]|uniref:TetR/AcrR family transcriptional regulator n=1 Tax=Roseomonas cutis TaxID=2897332 RepID=UPI001E60B335|nr:TetR/AcrR family transcriptional regulator [Roseomonas sp. OT10]UFN48924.1 TetR/AcrR family transcriptional regulator [Roseomonas sp. OT10]
MASRAKDKAHPPAGKVTSPMRSDARRNEMAIVKAAKTEFAKNGVDVPVRVIAASAGVGMGTLYRHFPKRSDLIVAVFRREIDACADDAATFASTKAPLAALAAWLQRYAEFIETKHGFSAALHSGDPDYDELPIHFRMRFEPALENLLETARSAGVVRADVTAFDLLRGIGNLATASGPGGPAHVRVMLGLIVDGLTVMRAD